LRKFVFKASPAVLLVDLPLQAIQEAMRTLPLLKVVSASQGTTLELT
jgi:hypothetical protein